MTDKLPNDFEQMLVATRYEFLKFRRGKKLLVVSALFILVLALLTVAPYLLDGSLPSDPKAFAEYYLIFLTSLIIIAVTLFGSDALSTEFEHRTGLLMFTRPVKRESLFAAKFIASFSMTLAVTLAFYFVVIVMSYVVTGSVVSTLFTSMGLAIIYVLAVTGLGFMLSAFLSRGATAAILIFASMMLVFPIIETVLLMANIVPWYNIHYAGEAVYHSVAGAMTVPTGVGFIEYDPKTGTSAAVLTIWAIVTTGLALIKFKRREL